MHEPVEAWRNSDFGEVLTRLDRQYLAGRKWTVEVEREAVVRSPHKTWVADSRSFLECYNHFHLDL